MLYAEMLTFLKNFLLDNQCIYPCSLGDINTFPIFHINTLSHLPDEEMQSKDQMSCPRSDRYSVAELQCLNPMIPL